MKKFLKILKQVSIQNPDQYSYSKLSFTINQKAVSFFEKPNKQNEYQCRYYSISKPAKADDPVGFLRYTPGYL